MADAGNILIWSRARKTPLKELRTVELGSRVMANVALVIWNTLFPWSVVVLMKIGLECPPYGNTTLGIKSKSWAIRFEVKPL